MGVWVGVGVDVGIDVGVAVNVGVGESVMVAVAVCVEVWGGTFVGRGVGLVLQAASASKKSKDKPLVTVRFQLITDLWARIRVSTNSPRNYLTKLRLKPTS